MNRRLLLVVGVMLLAGCAPQTWVKPGASGQDVVEAMNACQVTAKVGTVEVQAFADGGTKLVLPARDFDEKVFDTCMRSRGFVRTSGF
jgi:hypothetical protein